MLQAAAERVPFRMFFGRLLTAKPDPRDLRNLHDALHGDDGQKLLLYYQDFLRIGFTGIDGDKLLKMDMLASRYRLHIEQFDSAIAQALGIDMDSYEGLDEKGRIEHEGSYVEDIAYDLLRTVVEDEAAQK